MNAKTTKFLAVLAVLAMAFAAVAAIMPAQESSAAADTVADWDALAAKFATTEGSLDLKLSPADEFAVFDGTEAEGLVIKVPTVIDLNGNELKLPAMTLNDGANLTIKSTAAATAKAKEVVSFTGAISLAEAAEATVTVENVKVSGTEGTDYPGDKLYVTGNVQYTGTVANTIDFEAKGDATLEFPVITVPANDDPVKTNVADNVTLTFTGSDLNVKGTLANGEANDQKIYMMTVGSPAMSLIVENGTVVVDSYLEVTGSLKVNNLVLAEASSQDENEFNQLYVRQGGILTAATFTLNDAMPFYDRYGVDEGAKMVYNEIFSESGVVGHEDNYKYSTFNSYNLGKIVVAGEEKVALSYVHMGNVYSYFLVAPGTTETIKAPIVAGESSDNVGINVLTEGETIIGYADEEGATVPTYALGSTIEVQAGKLIYPVFEQPVGDLTLSGKITLNGPEADKSTIAGKTIVFTNNATGDKLEATIADDLTFTKTGFTNKSYRITIPDARALGYETLAGGAVTFETSDIENFNIKLSKVITVSGKVTLDTGIATEGVVIKLGIFKDKETWDDLPADRIIENMVAGGTYSFTQYYGAKYTIVGEASVGETLKANYKESDFVFETSTDKKFITLKAPTFSLTGTVEKDDKPMAGLELTIKDLTNDKALGTVTTDADGEYQFDGIKNETNVQVISADKKFKIVGVNEIAITNDDAELDLEAEENTWVVTLWVKYKGTPVEVPIVDGKGFTNSYWTTDGIKAEYAEEPEEGDLEITATETVGKFDVQLPDSKRGVLYIEAFSYNHRGNAYADITGWDQEITVEITEFYASVSGTATINNISKKVEDRNILTITNEGVELIGFYSNMKDASTNEIKFLFASLSIGDSGEVSLTYGGKNNSYVFKIVAGDDGYSADIVDVSLSIALAQETVKLKVGAGVTLTVDGQAYAGAAEEEIKKVSGAEITVSAAPTEQADENKVVIKINGETFTGDKYTIVGATTIEASFPGEQTEKFVATISGDDMFIVATAYDNKLIGSGSIHLVVVELIEDEGDQVFVEVGAKDIEIDNVDVPYYAYDSNLDIEEIIGEGEGEYFVYAIVTLGELPAKYTTYVPYVPAL